MTPSDSTKGPEIKVDLDNLYREEIFTDMKVATLRRLTPVKSDGSVDAARKTIFVGQTQVMTRAGMLPVEFGIEAQSIDEAAGKFPQAVQEAVEEMIDEARRMQREQASSLIIPGGGVDPSKLKMP
jgi:hypothetical protein